MVNSGNKTTGNTKATAVKGASVAILVLLIVAGMALVFAMPILVLATIDYALQDSLGFSETSAILEEQAGYIIEEQLQRGYFNAGYAEDLANNGIEVGEMTLAGDFIRTNNYRGQTSEIAAVDDDYSNSGELVVRFEGEIISANEFVHRLESNPRLYAAFAKATDITTRFYYSSDVANVYKNLGLSRNNFARYKQTKSIEEDKKQFEEIFTSVVERVANVGLNGYDRGQVRTFSGSSAEFDDGSSLSSFAASNVYGDNEAESTKRASSLLNIALSANEPYIAAGVFLATEEALNRARIDGDGPVDPLMNMLSEVNSVKVTDVDTGDDVVVKKSILRTKNFLAAIENEHYVTDDGKAYSRDRILNIMGEEVDKDARLGVKDAKQFGAVVKVGGDYDANGERLKKTSNSLSTTFYDDIYSTTKSSIGGNWIVMGGSFLSNSINSQVLGSMPSDKETIAEYKKEVGEVLARRAEADRATLSPFDISSENTFLGSLVKKLGNLMIKNYSSSSSVGGYLSSSMVGLVGDSLRSFNTARADGDSSFLMTNGDCPTANSAAGVEGDLYCTPHTTSDTSRMGWTLARYRSELSDSFNENGEIREGSPLAKFIVYGMGRGTTVGVKDAGICETYSAELSWLKKTFIKLKTLITDPASLYDACIGVPDAVADGSLYTRSSQNEYNNQVGLFSSYVLYDTVSAILDGRESSVAVFKEKYYSEHPQDDSVEGVLARRSGMSSEDTQLALKYAAYLNFLARYNPSEKYAFGRGLFNGEFFDDGFDILIRDKEFYGLLAIIGRESLYRDLRTLTTSSA